MQCEQPNAQTCDMVVATANNSMEANEQQESREIVKAQEPSWIPMQLGLLLETIALLFEKQGGKMM